MTPVNDPRTPAASSAPTPLNRPAPARPGGLGAAGAGALGDPVPRHPVALPDGGTEAPTEPPAELDNPQDQQTQPATHDEPGEIGVPAEVPATDDQAPPLA